ncbi:YtxH domain-containing protein [Lysinibacillus yapensis]|uniref:YtxH domain-containing protein n=1 Tax=Ureibacillus yapensis TaxID=2304605 RepID=A0A396S4X9_9BACL|nr:YtxH domain-containing protein [Lysinibacillus yapensis]RHW34750.1 YtxH domain-containing protein [Lysinibacillus yapensis]
MNESKLMKFVLVGAAAGAVISMFDRKTRENTKEKTKQMKDMAVYYAKNRDELQRMLEQKIEVAQEVYENASTNISTIISKMDDVKEIPASVQNMVSDTKNIVKNSNAERLN